MAAPDPARVDEAGLLHFGSRAGTGSQWGNLGLWSGHHDHDHDHDHDYADAAAALADAVANAAGVRRGARVLALGCGAGDELLRLTGHFGVGHVVGVEADGERARAARQRASARADAARITVVHAPALPWTMPADAFDAVTCVDAAYHLTPRAALLAGARASLHMGGGFAFTDLVIERSVGRGLLHALARACGLPAGDLVTAAQRLDECRRAGLDDARCVRMDEAVLGGFVAHVHRLRRRLGPMARGPAWRRIDVTARLIPAARALGLGYALFSGRRSAR